MRRLPAPLVRCALVLGLLLAPVACAGPEKDTVTIMVPWSGREFKAFYAVVKAFESSHPDIDVEPQVTRALTQQLDAAVAADAKPDLAVLPSVGAIAKYRKEGALRKLDVDTTTYVQPFRGLGMHGKDVYAVPVKADVKSLVWYDAEVTDPPTSWTRPHAGPNRWCLGLESGPTSGWPGADWIADILLADTSVGTYRAWASGTADWHKEPVLDAWTAWGDIVAGTPEGAATRNFRTVTEKMATKECSLSHGALSAMSFEPAQVRKGGYMYVPPSGKALQVSADFVGRFTGNESADAFIKYLTDAPAQQAWVDAPGFALSANSEVKQYANDIQGEIAAMLRSPRYTLCFSAADAMDPDVSAAFYRAVLDYANGKEPARLLTALNDVQKELGYGHPESPPPPEPLCTP